MANVRDKILHYRNHPSIAVWCARNEGYPPKEIDDRLRELMAELEPTRLYQPSSTAGRGVRSHGPYNWRDAARVLQECTDDFFKTETGSMSVPDARVDPRHDAPEGLGDDHRRLGRA